jgi:hypothetical protein
MTDNGFTFFFRAEDIVRSGVVGSQNSHCSAFYQTKLYVL